MGFPSGLSAQLGYKQETTWGTAVTPDTFVPFLSESLKYDPGILTSNGIITGTLLTRESQVTNGKITAGGDIQLEMYDRSVGVLLYHALGSVTTTATTAPYTHTMSVSSLFGKGLTVQVGRPDKTGTVQPFTYSGCKVASWEVAVTAGEIGTLGMTLVAQDETTATGLVSATFTTPTPSPMTGVYSGGSFSLAGSSLCVRSVKISGDNKLNVDRRCIGSRLINEPVKMDHTELKGEMTLEFPDLYHYNRFRAGTTGTMQFGLANQDGSSTLTVIANVRTMAAPVNVSNRDILMQTMSFACLATNSDAGAFTMVLTNSDSTP